MNSEDAELWDYFSLLYKNSNKGIKGRGKDRRVSSTSKTRSTSNNSRKSNTNNASVAPGINMAARQVGNNATPNEDDPAKMIRDRSYPRGTYLGTPNSDDVEFHEQMYQRAA